MLGVRLPARQQDESMQATDREIQLQMQLDKIQKEFDDFKSRSTSLLEEEMKQRDRTFHMF